MAFVRSAKWISTLCIVFVSCLLSSCGFHLQGQMNLAPPLHTMYLRTSDPYGYLSRTLKEYLKMSHVELVDSPEKAQTILDILSDTPSQNFVTVGGSQQTRQYNLIVTVVFQITDSQDRVLLGPQTLAEARALFLQSNQILGASNEATIFYQQMRRVLAYNIMNRLASKQVAVTLAEQLATPVVKKPVSEEDEN